MPTPAIRIASVAALLTLVACGGESLNGVKHKPPAVSAGADRQVAPGASVAFEATAKTDGGTTISKWAWDFGDGAQADTQTANHTYSNVGTFHVKVTATDDLGASGSASLTVTVAAPMRPLPVPVIDGANTAMLNTDFTLDGSKSTDMGGQIVTWAWAFNDGVTKTGTTATRQFALAGNYSVTLTVTDNAGASATSAPWEIRVAAAPADTLPAHSEWSYSADDPSAMGCGGFQTAQLVMDIAGMAIKIVEGGIATYNGTYDAMTRHFNASGTPGFGGTQTLDAIFSADYRQFKGNYLISVFGCNATIPITGHRTSPP
jgi:PKD repeat protein